MGARELLADLSGAGFAVQADGDKLVIRPASKLTEPLRAALLDAKAELLALLRTDHAPIGWTDGDIARFLDRRARLLRWGWPEAEAERIAERLVVRDRGGEDGVACVECTSFRPGACGNHKRAGLTTREVSRELAALFQRCDGFRSGEDQS